MDLESKIEMMQKCHLVAEAMANPRHRPVDMDKEYNMMLDDLSFTYNIKRDTVFAIVKNEQMYIEGLLPTQYKLDLGFGEDKIYQGIR